MTTAWGTEGGSVSYTLVCPVCAAAAAGKTESDPQAEHITDN